MKRQTLEEALMALGELLTDRGHSYEIVAIGGGSFTPFKAVLSVRREILI